jgi:hypothetical protein
MPQKDGDVINLAPRGVCCKLDDNRLAKEPIAIPRVSHRGKQSKKILWPAQGQVSKP